MSQSDMREAQHEREMAAKLPDDDVIGILLSQHARVRGLFADIQSATGEHKQQAFDELRAMLAAHETAEEMVLRPVTKEKAGEAVADARNAEEDQANKVLKQLEKLDVGSAEFDTMLAQFKQAVSEHAEHEETMEFPHILTGVDQKKRETMGKALKAAEAVAPTHPHPSTAGSPVAQWTVGPIASVADHARDAVNGVLHR